MGINQIGRPIPLRQEGTPLDPVNHVGDQIGSFRNEDPIYQRRKAVLDRYNAIKMLASGAIPLDVYSKISQMEGIGDYIPDPQTLADVGDIGRYKFMQTRPGRAISALGGLDPTESARVAALNEKRLMDRTSLPANVSAAWHELVPSSAPATTAPDESQKESISEPSNSSGHQLLAWQEGIQGQPQHQVFGNVLAEAGYAPLADRAYEMGLNEWKKGAMEAESGKGRFREALATGEPFSFEGPGGNETTTFVPPPGETRSIAPTMGRDYGDFRVRPGRGGFTPSAQVPTAGTLSQAEIEAMTPGQQRVYNENFGGMIARMQAEADVNPLAVYNRAAEEILNKQPEVKAKINALKADLDKRLADKVMDQTTYDALLAQATRNAIDEAMMKQGAAQAALREETYRLTGNQI